MLLKDRAMCIQFASALIADAEATPLQSGTLYASKKEHSTDTLIITYASPRAVVMFKANLMNMTVSYRVHTTLFNLHEDVHFRELDEAIQICSLSPHTDLVGEALRDFEYVRDWLELPAKGEEYGG